MTALIEKAKTALIDALHLKRTAKEAAWERVTRAEDAKRAAGGELYHAGAAHEQSQGLLYGESLEKWQARVQPLAARLQAAEKALDRAKEEEVVARAALDNLCGGIGVERLAAVKDDIAVLKRQAGEVLAIKNHLESKRSELALAREGLETLRGSTAGLAVDALLAGQAPKAGADKTLRGEEARIGDLEMIVGELELRHTRALESLDATRLDVFELVCEAAAAEASALMSQMLDRMKETIAAGMPRLLEVADVLRAAGSRALAGRSCWKGLARVAPTCTAMATSRLLLRSMPSSSLACAG